MLKNNLEDMAIPSVIEGEYHAIAEAFGNKFLLKPRRSYASKGIVVVSDEIAFTYHRSRMGDGFMAQKIMGNVEHEYTIGIFGLGDGSYSTCIALKRSLSAEGATAKAELFYDPLLDQSVDRLCSVLKPVGPTNFQFRYEDNHYFLLEVNPRISSSTSIRAALGYNDAEMCISYFINNEIIRPVIQNGKAVRFIDEIVIMR
jgi:carbamoyl-phosphate synthase large subunit